MRQIKNLSCCLLVSLNSFAQNLNFIFVYQDIESSNNIGVAGVTVEVENSKTNKVTKAITNTKGEAVFNLASGSTYEVYVPLEDFSFELATEKFRKYSNATAKISHKGNTPAYYKEMAIQDSLDMIAWEKKEAEWERKKAEDAKKLGTMLFYCINPEGRYTQGIKIYDGGINGKLLGEANYYWRKETCTGSVKNAKKKIAVTKNPGTYTYYAKTGDGLHEWSGEYIIVGSSTQKIALNLEQAKKLK